MALRDSSATTVATWVFVGVLRPEVRWPREMLHALRRANTGLILSAGDVP